MTDPLQQHLDKRTDPIERLRAHIEKHKHKLQANFSIAGVAELLRQRDELKIQVERMLAGRAEAIGKDLIANHKPVTGTGTGQ